MRAVSLIAGTHLCSVDLVQYDVHIKIVKLRTLIATITNTNSNMCHTHIHSCNTTFIIAEHIPARANTFSRMKNNHALVF